MCGRREIRGPLSRAKAKRKKAFGARDDVAHYDLERWVIEGKEGGGRRKGGGFGEVRFCSTEAPGVSGVLSVDPEGGSVQLVQLPRGTGGARRIADRDVLCTREGQTDFAGGRVAPRRHGILQCSQYIHAVYTELVAKMKRHTYNSTSIYCVHSMSTDSYNQNRTIIGTHSCTKLSPTHPLSTEACHVDQDNAARDKRVSSWWVTAKHRSQLVDPSLPSSAIDYLPSPGGSSLTPFDSAQRRMWWVLIRAAPQLNYNNLPAVQPIQPIVRQWQPLASFL